MASSREVIHDALREAFFEGFHCDPNAAGADAEQAWFRSASKLSIDAPQSSDTDDPFTYKGFAPDEDGFGEQGDTIGISMFSAALQVWSWAQPGGSPTIDEAAEAFRCPVSMIVQAVEHHPWMLISKGRIEHDGE